MNEKNERTQQKTVVKLQRKGLESQYSQHEDAALKTVMQFFAQELLPYWGIKGKVLGLAPTELVYLEIKKMYQDANLIMEDGSWKHFEFQSKNEGVAGLKRFRVYEAVTSQQFQVPVTTYVLFSGKIKNPMTEFSEGVNTYQIVPIIMQKENADEFLSKLIEKRGRGEAVTREELIRLTMCPLMGGETEIKERIKAAYGILKDENGVNTEEKSKIEAVIYAMAEKFLEGLDMEEIKEDLKMTRLGQMLVREGIKEGAAAKEAEIAKRLIGILPDETIIEKIGISKERLQKVKSEGKQETDPKRTGGSAEV